MLTRPVATAITILCVVEPRSLTFAAESPSLRRALYVCFEGCPSSEELNRRFRNALRKYRGTCVEDDLLLHLARVEIRMGRVKQAILLLQRLRDDRSATTVDLTYLWCGAMRDQEIPVAQEREKLYGASPDLTSDHALLVLSLAYRRLGRMDAAWRVLEELRNRYPNGDSVERDLSDAAALAEKHVTDPDQLQAWSMARHFACRVRPHLSGLLDQAALCREREKLADRHVAILAHLLRCYHSVLRHEEVSRYCSEGLRLVRENVGKMPKQKLEKLESIFRNALKVSRGYRRASGDRAFYPGGRIILRETDDGEGRNQPPTPEQPSDHILLTLGKEYERVGMMDEAWTFLERLRNRRPNGHRPRPGEADAVTSAEGHVAKPEERVTPGETEESGRRLMPHLSGLLRQARLCREHDQFAHRRLDILAQLVRCYRWALTREALSPYCNEGLKLVSQKVQGMSQQKHEELVRIFRDALGTSKSTQE